MASPSGRYFSSSQSYAPSAPSLPESYDQLQQQQERFGYGYQSGYGYYGQHETSYGHRSSFPPGTHPDVIRSFELVDRDRSGFIDEIELQQALSSGYQRFSLRTIRLLVFIFTNPCDSLRIGE